MPSTAATQPTDTMSKGEFADLCNVAKSRVSHWIKDGRISGAALSGAGRTARIVVEIAQAQLKARLEPHQMLNTGNGGRTNLSAKPVADAVETVPLSPDADKLAAILTEVPSSAAWQAAEAGETTQRAFDTFMNMRLDTMAELRRRGFIVDEDAFEPVDWPGLADEMGMTLIDPDTMAADWQRRRDED